LVGNKKVLKMHKKILFLSNDSLSINEFGIDFFFQKQILAIHPNQILVQNTPNLRVNYAMVLI